MKFNWVKGLIFYISMAWGGTACWIVSIMSFRGWWKGALVGVGLATAFILSMEAIELYCKHKPKIWQARQWILKRMKCTS